MAIRYVCVRPFHQVVRGQEFSEKEFMENHYADHELNFVRRIEPDPPAEKAPEAQAKK